jgi:Uma2 family endonuclease
LQADLIEKAELYGQAGILECWIIDIQGRCIHVFRAPVEGKYKERSVFKPGELLLPIAECSKALDIEDLFGK